MFVYLDNSATTKPYSDVIESMFHTAKTDYGNPSSLHRLGLAAEKILKSSRKSVAQSLGAGEDEIYFTSGGTEADNIALFGAAEARKRRGNKIITSKIEHPAVLESCKKLESMGYKVEYVGVDPFGVIDLSEFEAAVDQDTILISVMQVNNEVGSIQPIKEISQIKRRFAMKFGTDILQHADAVQSYGKIRIDLKSSDIDLVSVSGHKIHGPKGIGALYIKKGTNIHSLIHGGGQERGLRSGTENMPAIAGFAAAAEISSVKLDERIEKMSAVNKYLLEGIRTEINDVRFNSTAEGSPSILNVSFLGVRGEVLLHTLEQQDIYVSTGSACSSNKKGKSHVLKAMGLTDKEIEGAIRFSFSEFNTISEMDYVLENLKKAILKFRKLGSFR